MLCTVVLCCLTMSPEIFDGMWLYVDPVANKIAAIYPYMAFELMGQLDGENIVLYKASEWRNGLVM